MSTMPKMIDPELQARAVASGDRARVRVSVAHGRGSGRGEAAWVGKESVPRWVIQAQVDTGERDGVTTEEQAEVKKMKAESRRLREDVAILRAATTFLASMPRLRCPVGLSSFRCMSF